MNIFLPLNPNLMWENCVCQVSEVANLSAQKQFFEMFHLFKMVFKSNRFPIADTKGGYGNTPHGFELAMENTGCEGKKKVGKVLFVTKFEKVQYSEKGVSEVLWTDQLSKAIDRSLRSGETVKLPRTIRKHRLKLGGWSLWDGCK